ncbi:hypothetical protein [Aureimonas sp. N4]|uniref:hypothetical protein n=1 Tax=Aureimonas sp. N4 TaxID=1638165 RepID=UPI000780ED1D|nr:hypothetical protein [Aureimonas sp. N4]
MFFSFNAVDEHCTGDRRELRAIELHEVSIVLAWPGCKRAVITALACIRLIAETLAAMPLEPHRFSEGWGSRPPRTMLSVRCSKARLGPA